MKSLITNKLALNESWVKAVLILAIVSALLFVSNHVFATDLLAGTDTDIKDTLKGTGRHWILYFDGIAAVIGFIGRKNPAVFGSILAVTVFMNVLTFLTK
jgi:hypothetical protein